MAGSFRLSVWFEQRSTRVAKVRVLVQPTGCINGAEWPAVGGVLELPDAVAASMADAGTVEVVASKVEKRPAPKKRVETREV